VTDLARLSLVAESGRGHGALYDGLNAGAVDAGRLLAGLAGLPLPRWPDGRIRLGIDVPNWLRPGEQTSPERMFCHVHGRGRNAGQRIPGWPHSVVMTPGRVRAGFRHARQTAGSPASVAQPARPGPGRPPGSKTSTKHPAQPVGKTSPKKRKPAKNPRRKTNQTG
jgi:hypothetical protein